MAVYHPNTTQDEFLISFEEWETKAREKLSDGLYHYIADGAGSGGTMRENREAFDHHRIFPRMMCNVDERDLSVHLFGETFPAPIMLAPVGVQSIAHQEGELATASAASKMGVPYITSTVSSHTMEEIADTIEDAPKWFQLYWGRDPEVTASMLRRAESAGKGFGKCLFGLAVGGEEGVSRVIRNLWADFVLNVALSGKKNLDEIDRSILK